MTQAIHELNEASQPASSGPETTELADEQPTFLFFGVVASISLALDVASKAWAALALENRLEPIVVIENHLSFTWALNRGGAWGILQDAGEMVRKPFFFVVSVLAIGFIVSLYSRLQKGQTALKWGLPLVLGGALGNLADRIVRGSVIDFIDYRADWVGSLNTWIKGFSSGWSVTDHWPTFNVADISICIGVLLMAVDMFTSRRQHKAEAASAGTNAVALASSTSAAAVAPEATTTPASAAPTTAAPTTAAPTTAAPASDASTARAEPGAASAEVEREPGAGAAPSAERS